MSRRVFLQRVAAGGAVLGGAALAGCAGIGGKAALSTQKPKILLTLRPWGYAPTPSASESTINELLEQAAAPWLQQNPGVEIKMVPDVGGAPALVSALLAGGAPDIYHDYHPDAMFASPGYTTDLTKLLKDRHANLSVFNKAQMQLFMQPNGILALPAYLGIKTLAVNLGLVDHYGLQRPAPGWTHTDFATLCQQIASASASQVVGAGFGLGQAGGSPNAYMPPQCVLAGFGGNYVNPVNNAECTLDTPESVQAFEWSYGLAKTNAIAGPGVAYSLHENTAGMTWAGSWAMIQYATTWQTIVWDFYDMPSFPVPNAPVSSATSDFYALNPASAHLDLAWDLLYWMVFEPEWQRSMMKIFLLSPALMSLWDEWVTKVQAYAPPLASKNVAAFRDLAQGGHAYPEAFMLYQADTAYQYMANWGQEMWSGSVSIQEGLTGLVHQINGLEQTGAQIAGVTNRAASAISSVKPGPKTQYPTPPTSGAGAPASPSPYVIVQKSTGTYTLLGDGSDIGGTTDNCVFAAAAETATEGQWTCRLTGLANISESGAGSPLVASWVRAGIMARGDLTDNSAMVLLTVAGNYGFDFIVRTAPEATAAEKKFIFWKNAQGVYQSLVSPLANPTSNFIPNPIWLRLTRKGTTWTPYASLDGTHFTALAAPAVATSLAGAWVGMTVNAYNTEFNKQGYVRATFDNATFTPTQMVQIGVSGTPPSAGAVPSNWATLTTPVPVTAG
jgi:maltose-binding protein MalE